MGKNIHIVPSSDGWAVREGDKQAASFRTKADAIDAGRRLARKKGAQQVVHDRDGRIVESSTYARDPFPPRDKS